MCSRPGGHPGLSSVWCRPSAASMPTNTCGCWVRRLANQNAKVKKQGEKNNSGNTRIVFARPVLLLIVKHFVEAGLKPFTNSRIAQCRHVIQILRPTARRVLNQFLLVNLRLASACQSDICL